MRGGGKVSSGNAKSVGTGGRKVASKQVAQNIQIVAWNLENLFHPSTGGPRFNLTPHEGWTIARYNAKVKRIAKAIESMVAARKKGLGCPFVIGLTEVENERVVKDLLSHLPKNFAFARDSRFGLDYHDCVIIYDKTGLELADCEYRQVFERFPRGDVVRADFRVKNTEVEFSVFCCHLKARPSNQYYTEMYRQAVCDDMQTAIWNMHGGKKALTASQRLKNDAAKKPESLKLDKNVFVLGDFNDEPFSRSMIEYLNASYDKNYVMSQKTIKRVVLYNCAWEWLAHEKPGSYFWEKGAVSSWSLLDQIVISPALLTGAGGLKYTPNSFRVQQDVSANEQGVPFSSCKWDENDNIVWTNGYSDHFPVRVDVKIGP